LRVSGDRLQSEQAGVELHPSPTARRGSVHYPSDQSAANLQQLMADHHVQFDSKGTGGSPWWSILTSLLPLRLAVSAFWIFLMNQGAGAGGSKVMSFGKVAREADDARLAENRFQRTSPGSEEAVEELQEIKEFLENPKKFQAPRAQRIPKGRAAVRASRYRQDTAWRAPVAGEGRRGRSFSHLRIPTFVEMFRRRRPPRACVTSSEQAKQASPCIVFHGTRSTRSGRHRRGAGSSAAVTMRREQTLNQAAGRDGRVRAERTTSF